MIRFLKSTLLVIVLLGIMIALNGCIISNQSPVAKFNASALRPAATFPVDFDASTSSDSDGTIIRYDWDFGDGAIGSGIVVAHVFQNPTTNQIIPYTVTLNVIDNDRGSDSASVIIQVTPAPPGAPEG